MIVEVLLIGDGGVCDKLTAGVPKLLRFDQKETPNSPPQALRWRRVDMEVLLVKWIWTQDEGSEIKC